MEFSLKIDKFVFIQNNVACVWISTLMQGEQVKNWKFVILIHFHRVFKHFRKNMIETFECKWVLWRDRKTIIVALKHEFDSSVYIWPSVSAVHWPSLHTYYLDLCVVFNYELVPITFTNSLWLVTGKHALELSSCLKCPTIVFAKIVKKKSVAI